MTIMKPIPAAAPRISLPELRTKFGSTHLPIFTNVIAFKQPATPATTSTSKLSGLGGKKPQTSAKILQAQWVTVAKPATPPKISAAVQAVLFPPKAPPPAKIPPAPGVKKQPKKKHAKSVSQEGAPTLAELKKQKKAAKKANKLAAKEEKKKNKQLQLAAALKAKQVKAALGTKPRIYNFNALAGPCALTMPWGERLQGKPDIIFVSSESITNASSGDARLRMDLPLRLAAGFNTTALIGEFTEQQLQVKLFDKPNTLIICINKKSDIMQLSAHYPRNFLRVGITNDVGWGSQHHIYFDPIYIAPITETWTKSALAVYPVTCLPSRITPMNIYEAADAAEEAKRFPALAPGQKTLAVVIGGMGKANLADLLTTCRNLQKKHNLRLLFTTGPKSSVECESFLAEQLAEIPNSYLYAWAKDNRGQNNAYLPILGAADYIAFAPSTLSTASDMIATGKPVFLWSYSNHEMNVIRKLQDDPFALYDGEGTTDIRLLKKLACEGILRVLDEDAFDHIPDRAEKRQFYAEEWNRACKEFALNVMLSLNAFDPNCVCRADKIALANLPEPMLKAG